ncbi:hypothetical protein HYQ45_008248 [Verticillium longisporum]|uniref:RNase MRP protein 1 RNA binding domain-containing protein n=2 Tax=Verticillium TaxID=1036719 RepID=A0A8I3AR04_VERLO|nr:hypothetical protein HYQ45_008248 [Verticillium longisporum]PNH42303.1 hypothetical protein VD0004_g4983 [Verticillium dahliae]PNH68077.1 hypothetical protein VD0001_g7614 [Verticillium dahliae]RXG43744.1 hypothetical protein VDGE_06312 [Verticillium dahliae]
MPPPSPDAADALASVLHILDRFHHRHRNQHRVAKWWVHFTLLRRALRRLDAAILAHQRRLRTSSSSTSFLSSSSSAAARARPPKTKPTDNAGPRSSRRAPTALETSEAAVTAHARWLVLHVLPAAYVAFTQLAADGQHAPLGLLLIALAARLDALLAPLNPTPRSPDAAAAAAAVQQHLHPAEPNDDLDLGVAVARPSLAPDVARDGRRDANGESDPLDSRTSPPLLSPTLSPETTAKLPVSSSSSSEPLLNPIPKSKPKANSKSNPKSNPQSKFTSKPQASVSKPVEPKKKKKKPKGGDEFADLFSSLL